MKEERVIAVNGLTKRYKKQFAVKEAGFAIKRGSICGLIGPNGAGKTTIMKMLGGLVLPTAGNISLYGGRSERELAKARERMSFMIEIPYAKLDLTAWQNLEKQRIQKGIPDKERPKKVMELVGLSDVGSKKLKAVAQEDKIRIVDMVRIVLDSTFLKVESGASLYTK